MAIVNEIADSFLDVLEKHAQIDEKKEKALLKMDQYRDFMKSQGFTKDMLTKYDDTLDSILAAEYRYAAKQLQENISDLIKAGKVISQLTLKLSLRSHIRLNQVHRIRLLSIV